MEDRYFNTRKIYDLIQARQMGKYSSDLREFKDLDIHCFNNLVKNFRYIVNNPDAQSPDAHAEFLKRIQYDGWKYGEHRDIEKKLEPWCVPYSELTDEQKMIWTVGYINTKFLTTHESAEAKSETTSEIVPS